jgi:hypothetical protein
MKKQQGGASIKSPYKTFPDDFPRVGSWEIDLGASPMPLPFPAPTILIVEHESYFILNTEVVSNEDPFLAFREAISHAVSRNQMLPNSFLVKTPEIAEFVRPVAEEMGVSCEMIKKLKAIPNIRKEMTKIFGNFGNTTRTPAVPARNKKKTAAPVRASFSEHPKEIFQFKITLKDVSPAVWRRILVPSDYSFFELYVAIESAMGWGGGHLHSFSIAQQGTKIPILIELPHPDNDFGDIETLDERTEKIADYFGKSVKQCLYNYDFGDDWTHTVLFEKVIPVESGVKYPRCIDGKNACPPDDCGGPWGYANLIDVLKNPKHEEHEDILDWLCIESADEFDSTEFDPKDVVFDNPKKRLSELEKDGMV